MKEATLGGALAGMVIEKGLAKVGYKLKSTECDAVIQEVVLPGELRVQIKKAVSDELCVGCRWCTRNGCSLASEDAKAERISMLAS